MKTFFAILFFGMSAFGARDYHGNFSQVNVNGDQCAPIFEAKTYDATLRLMGSGGTTAVLFFSDFNRKGFFHEMTFVGRNGGMGDILFEKELEKDKHVYSLIADGIFDYGFIFIKISVETKDPVTGSVLCSASGEYTGF